VARGCVVRGTACSAWGGDQSSILSSYILSYYIISLGGGGKEEIIDDGNATQAEQQFPTYTHHAPRTAPMFTPFNCAIWC